MRYLFWFLLLPLGLLWSWIGLSFHDVNFGTLFLSRQMHDLVFGMYASILGIEQSAVLPLLAKACVFDLFLVGCIFAFRRRKKIRGWWQARNGETSHTLAENQLPVAAE